MTKRLFRSILRFFDYIGIKLGLMDYFKIEQLLYNYLIVLWLFWKAYEIIISDLPSRCVGTSVNGNSFAFISKRFDNTTVTKKGKAIPNGSI